MAVNDCLPPKHYPIPPRTAPHNSGLRPQYGEPDAAPRAARCEPCDDVRPSTSPMVNAFWGGGTSLCPAVEPSEVHRFYNAKYARARRKTQTRRRSSEPCGLLPRLAGPPPSGGGDDAGEYAYEAEASRALVRSRGDAERCLVSQQYDAKLKVLDAAWEHFVQLHRREGTEARRYVFSLKCADDGTTLWEVDSADARGACDAPPPAATTTPHGGSLSGLAVAVAAGEGYETSRALAPASAQAPVPPPPVEEQLALPEAAAGGGGGGGDARPSRALAGAALAGVAPSMETALSAAFRRALRYADGREESMAAELSDARRRLEEATGAGSVFRGLQQANGRLRLEAAASREKMAELVGLTERLGAEVRGLRTKNEQLTKEVQWVSKTTATEQGVYQEARRLALRLQVQVDELESVKTDQQVQQLYAEDLLAKSRRRNRLLENERRVLLKTRGPDVEELVKGLYTRFKADQEKDGEKRGERLTGGAGGESTVRPYLKGLGTNSSVPVSLRHAGRVRNLKLGKGTIERIIREVWVARYSVHVQTQELPAVAGGRVIGGAAAEVALKCAVRDEAFDTIDYGNVQKIIGGRVPFQRFFHEYVTERWHNAVEWAYSILDACERYRYAFFYSPPPPPRFRCPSDATGHSHPPRHPHFFAATTQTSRCSSRSGRDTCPKTRSSTSTSCCTSSRRCSRASTCPRTSWRSGRSGSSSCSTPSAATPTTPTHPTPRRRRRRP